MKRVVILLVVLGLFGAVAYVAMVRKGPSGPGPTTEVVDRPRRVATPAPIEEKVDAPAGAPWGRPERLAARKRRNQLLQTLARVETVKVEAQVRARIKAADNHQPPPTGTGFGTLDRDYIKAKIGEIKPLMKECYELGLAQKPDLAGRLVVKFSIVADPDHGGVVERAEVVPGKKGSGDLDDPTVQECVKETVKSITFEPPKNGGRVMVRYPFLFAQIADGGAPAGATDGGAGSAADGGAAASSDAGAVAADGGAAAPAPAGGESP